MSSETVKVLNIPLFPYLKPGQKKTQPIKRLRPQDSLNLKKIVRELDKNSVITLNINKKPWSVVSVFSSYSPDIHIMLCEKSTNRFLPGPEGIPAKEGEQLMPLCAAILKFISERKTNLSMHIGYNWSPRAWGREEEKTGFQSLPTKWHPHIWGWPSLNVKKSTKQKFIKLVKAKSLSKTEQRLLGYNDYAKPFGQIIQNEIRKTFHKGSLLFKLFPHENWRIDGRGIHAVSDLPLLTIFGQKKSFTNILKPIALMLESLTADLTGILTDMNCKEIDRILIQTQKGIPENWKKLRKRPVMKSPDSIIKQFKDRGYPESFLKAVFNPVKNRCNEQGNPQNWWRKGFGYALVLTGFSKDNTTKIRIMPGLYIGPGGVVEAQGVILRRPEDKQLSQMKITEKSKVLWNLAEYLKQQGFREYKTNI